MRKKEPEGCSLIFFTVDPESALMRLDDTMDHGQAETGSRRLVFRREEGIKDLVDNGGGNPRSIIGHRQLDIVALREIVDLCLFRREGCLLKADLQFSAIFTEGLKGIGAEIHQCLVDLGGISQDGTYVR